MFRTVATSVMTAMPVFGIVIVAFCASQMPGSASGMDFAGLL